MGLRNRLCGVLLLVTLFSLVFTQHAYAYLDPGTGSYFLQLLIAGLLGALFFIKSFWKGVARTFKNVFSRVFGFIKRGTK